MLMPRSLIVVLSVTLAVALHWPAPVLAQSEVLTRATRYVLDLLPAWA